MSAVIEAAIAMGLPCFPCRPDNKAPTIPGPGGFNHATADPAALSLLWRRYPGELVGVPTGQASGLSVLDIDGPKHPEADLWLTAHRVQLPATRIHRTRSGGLHLVFCHAPGVRTTRSRLAKGVDTCASGSYVIWWPAASFPVVCDAPPAQWPQWLLEALAPPIPKPYSAPTARLDAARFEGVLHRVKFACESERNNTLFWGSCRLGEAVVTGEIAGSIAATALLRAA